MIDVPDEATSPAKPVAESTAGWAVEIGLAAVVLVIGLYEARVGFTLAEPTRGGTLVAIGMAASVALFRRAPGFALLLVWLACSIQVFERSDVMLVQLSTVVVAYGTARYGSRSVLAFSGLSLPVGGVIAIAYVMHSGTTLIYYIYRLGVPVPNSYSVTPAGAIAAGVFCFAVLAAPWLAGLAVRARHQATASRLDQVRAEDERARAEQARSQAQEVAQVRAEQARLARDVHDVVGHSLAVILAQAESAQFLDPDDTERIQQTMRNIATSARQSLRDVRQVLSSTNDEALLSFDELIDGVRAAGNDVRSEVIGTPLSLPSGTDLVAFRVLQEMLTNALKHGRRSEPIEIEQQWTDGLRIQVRNRIGEVVLPSVGGIGIEGMRRRLETVRGRLEVGREHDEFTATAWIPGLRHLTPPAATTESKTAPMSEPKTASITAAEEKADR